jgi:hypothetical protein
MINGLMHSISQNNWDAIFINGRSSCRGCLGLLTYAYDSLAYVNKTQSNQIYNSVVMNYKLLTNNNLIKVKSAFNGVGLYKISSILKASYISNEPICEHIKLHKSMIKNGKNKLYLNPQWIGYFDTQGTSKATS